MTTYSSFFSSGLLAAHHAVYNNFSTRELGSGLSPSTLTVSDSLEHTSDVELDRSVTPTPMNIAQTGSSSVAQGFSAQPKLRRRRSSLTMATSPINAIKSPARSAGNAMQFQRHLYASPGVPAVAVIASKGKSLLGRLRSGSVGSVLKSRRGIRRVPGPSLPPPSAPLPPLPSLPTIPGTPTRSKTKSFSIHFPSGTSPVLARKLAVAGGAGEVTNFVLQSTHYIPVSPTSMSPRQPWENCSFEAVTRTC
ncbi:hypothetical protein D9757_014073 [Collybiopsis confluens]|uniref:Uncharacterized protein n=1 Tax=Collybiopsis confluens TaxID=2823264 RepID=A0A8H5CQJ6_9AGAR|nr:hypothetical protein D9757_014073 [Collybiopsis confluens]